MTEVDLSLGSARHNHYVDWGSIIAGAFVAVAASTIFLAFGSAIGLSMTSFQSTSAASATGLAVAGALWLLWVQVSSFAGGGYIAGRMRRQIGDGKPHEVEMRDGVHGLIVWAVGVVLGVGVAGTESAKVNELILQTLPVRLFVSMMTRMRCAPALRTTPVLVRLAQVWKPPVLETANEVMLTPSISM